MNHARQWLERLKAQVRSFPVGDHLPAVWMDGFRDVLLFGDSSHPDDNPYMPEAECERAHFAAYRDGARAAESLLAAIGKEES